MMRLSTVYSNANTPLFIKNNGLVKHQSKAPVHWGVNATLFVERVRRKRSKAPVHWGVNATCTRSAHFRARSKAPVHWGVKQKRNALESKPGHSF